MIKKLKDVYAVVTALICMVVTGGIVYGLVSANTVSKVYYQRLQDDYAALQAESVPRSQYDELQANSVPKVDFNALQAEYNAVVKLVPKPHIKAGFIYVATISDYGWSNAHDVGRRYVDDEFDWLDTVYVESVSPNDLGRIIDRLILEEKCDVIFTTSFDFMPGTVDAAKKYPDKMFFHCSGNLRAPNLGTYFADFVELYYLNGLMAGAVSKAGKIGYVGAQAIPEVERHINAFTLGAREINPTATVSVKWIDTWYSPDKAREAAEALIAEGCDTLAFTEDSPTVLQIGQDYMQKGIEIFTFSHYSPMQKFGPDSCVSGQLVHWELLYERILTNVYLGVYNNTNLQNVDLLYMMEDSGVELGGEFGVPINPKFVPLLQAKTVTDPILGRLSVYDLVMTRMQQMGPPRSTFDPFIGPIKDNTGNLKIPAGTRATLGQLFGERWFVEGVIGNPTP